MANKIIKYTLNSNGSIPDYIEDGGYYPKSNGGSSPQNHDLIGATVDGSSEVGIGELISEAAVKSYLDSYTSSWVEGSTGNIPTSTTPFNQASAASYIWSKKIT